MKILIPAKGVSKRIPHKNLQPLARGLTLLEWAIENWRQILPDAEMHIATEDAETITIATARGCQVYPLTVDDIADRRFGTDLFIEFCQRHPATPDEPNVLAECVAPFTFGADVKRALQTPGLIVRSGYSGVLHTQSNQWRLSQDIAPEWVITANFMLVRGDVSGVTDWGQPEMMVPVNQLSLLDINTPEDLAMARWLAERIDIHDLLT